MLKIVTSMSQLNIADLMIVYREDNLENGKILFPDTDPNEQLRRAEDEFESYLREDFFRQKDSFYALWVTDGHYQAALRIEPYDDGLLLEALSTAPGSRHRGYAAALVSHVLKHLQASSYTVVYSHIHKNNTASLQLHKKCGFQLHSESARYLDGTVTQKSCTMCYCL